MSQTKPGSQGASAPTDEQQRSDTATDRQSDFSDFSDWVARARETGGRQSTTKTAVAQCQAIAVSTSERCERDALAGVTYCPLHLDRVSDDTTG